MRSHKVHNAEVYSFLQVNYEVQNEFTNYFNSGITPSAAKPIMK